MIDSHDKLRLDGYLAALEDVRKWADGEWQFWFNLTGVSSTVWQQVAAKIQELQARAIDTAQKGERP